MFKNFKIFRNIKMFSSKSLIDSQLSSDDCLLVSYPRSGNTFFRFLYANIISAMYLDRTIVNFYNLGEIMPELGKDTLDAIWPYEKIPRIIKTHDTFSCKFESIKAIYLVRDPRDVMISYFHYLRKKRGTLYRGTLSDFVRDEKFGAYKIQYHFDSWKNHKNLLIIRYEDLKRQTEAELIRADIFMNTDIPIDILKYSIEKSSKENVRRFEKEYGRPNLEKKLYCRTFVYTRWIDRAVER